MTMLRRTQDRKTANSVTPNGKQSRIANAFSLPAGREYSCAGATEYCNRICYAGKLEKLYKGFRATVLHNWELLKDADFHEMLLALHRMINEFERECDKWDAPKLFRIHADGDFFNSTYIYAWRRVMMMHPNVQFWTYTRVFDAAYHLRHIENLSIYFSSDPENMHTAEMAFKHGIKIAHVDNTFAEGKLQWSKSVRCPEQTKALPMINNDGGACARCGLCVNGRNNVLFSASKK